jgi:hypothetical protein
MFEYECYHDDYGDKWIPKRYIAETPGKAKYQHAEYLHNELNYGYGIFDMLKKMMVRKIGPANIYFYFKDNDTWENVKKSRNIEFAYLGMEVDVCGKRGVIVAGNSGLNLNVLFNYGTKQQYIDNCHPWYETVYYDVKGNVLADYREKVV